ncbi:MAG TPA: PQQ-binding-like beta-propeller repeat protein [bacterium]|nr:PQQ-binding-like beta-propeller repeat protein [bacterium]
MKRRFFIQVFCLSLSLFSSLFATDWPMWRYDAGRTASSPEELASRLYLQWMRAYTPRAPVWDDSLNQDLMPLDRVLEPIVLGQRLYVGFNDQDRVVALDLNNGAEVWSFYADGPIRLPLAGYQGRLYFTSDDGYLYCLSAAKGDLLWKFRGGPCNRMNLGNKRMISSWPARGGLVIHENVLYFAAGIWPFMGIFIHALDPETGKEIWRNDGSGAQYTVQPHNSPAFAGVAPQGSMAISGARLLVPSGRSVPACFDRTSGELLYYRLANYNKTGGAFVCATDQLFFNHYRDRGTDLYDAHNGDMVARNLGKYPVLCGHVFYMSGDSIVVRHAENPKQIQRTLHADASGDLIKSGSRLYAGGAGKITALSIQPDGGLKVDWIERIDGTVGRLLSASGKLVAVTQEGKLFVFGDKPRPPVVVQEKRKTWIPGRKALEQVSALVENGDRPNGYALISGLQDKELVAALVQATDYTFIAIDADGKRISTLRTLFNEWGYPSSRIHFLQASPASMNMTPYFASLIVVNNPAEWLEAPAALNKLFSLLRPYDGRLWMPSNGDPAAEVLDQLQARHESELTVQTLEHGLLAERKGPLPGTSNWTHQYGNIANTVKSDDRQVKLPLGLLWFGGVSNLDVLPRHGHGPPEQIVDGRLFIQGIQSLSARDVYTGRLLWKRDMDSLGTFNQYYDDSYKLTHLVVSTNQVHIPGANARGSNFVVAADFLYVIQGDSCHVLDVRDGRTVKYFALVEQKTGEAREWGYIGVTGDHLIVGLDFVPFSSMNDLQMTDQEKVALSTKELGRLRHFGQFDLTASRTLAVMDRQTGQVKWQIDSRHGFIHNAIVVGGRQLYCLDKLPLGLEKRLQRRGAAVPSDYRLLCLDIETGAVLWEKNTGIFGSWLSYSQEYDLLLQATRPSRDMVIDEKGERMAVYRAASGELVWDKPILFNNPPILHHDEIITDNAAYGLLTGDPIQRLDPITGESIPWSYSRNYGCNYAIASEHLLSFRSAAAGFYALDNDGGTGNWGGFRGGCTSNLIAANGVLNAPDYTRTCQCSYQNQTSLAFIHMPELEYWTFNDYTWNGKPVKRVGLNLNAPGDRKAADGTLWLDFPSVGGKSPDLPVQWDTTGVRRIRRHALTLPPNGWEWVAASGLSGTLRLAVTIAGEPMPDARYTVRLHFAELEPIKPGERKFDVFLQKRKVMHDFDIAAAAGGVYLPVIKSFEHIAVDQQLFIECAPSETGSSHPPLLCGIEIIQEAL